MSKGNRIFRYVLFYCTTVIVCVGMLIAGACTPQSRVDAYVEESAEIMITEGCYPRISDRTYGSRLDNWTDSIILMSSKAMSRRNYESIFTNPMYESGGKDPVERLYHYTHDDNPEPTSYYTRYWMGFRWVMRFALAFANYYQLKRYLAFLLFALFAGVIGLIAQRVNVKTSMAFAISILLIRPYVVCNSVQFSICFVIAFIAMLCVPWIHKKPKHEKLFFMEVGMLTMYFDFYTTPIITLGLPIVFLYVLREREGRHMKMTEILADAGVWFLAYVAMWITKLLLTNVFTSVDALGNGFSSLYGWLGINGVQRKSAQYNPILALGAVAYSIVSDLEGLKIALVILMSGLVGAIAAFLKRRIGLQVLSCNKNLLFIAILPLLWFVIASEPTTVHFWFQYRSVALLYWAVGAYISLVFEQRK